MSSRAELDKIFHSLVKKYTDRQGYTDWLSVVEHLQTKEMTTLRNRQWKWRNAESWWLRNRKRIMEDRAKGTLGNLTDKTGAAGNVGTALKDRLSEDQGMGTSVQLGLDFS
jgi:hypothetical protein